MTHSDITLAVPRQCQQCFLSTVTLITVHHFAVFVMMMMMMMILPRQLGPFPGNVM